MELKTDIYAERDIFFVGWNQNRKISRGTYCPHKSSTNQHMILKTLIHSSEMSLWGVISFFVPKNNGSWVSFLIFFVMFSSN